MRYFRIVNINLRFFRISYGGFIMEDIILRIATECSRNGINGNELGKLLHLRKSPLTDWKNQKSKPTLEQLVKMCDIFAVSADYLLFGSCNNLLSESENNMLSKYRCLSIDNQEEIISIIEIKLQRISNESGVKSKLSSSENTNAV